MRGRKATPTSLRLLRTTSKKAEKLVKRQIETPGALIDAPEWMTADQKQDWQYTIENAPRELLRRIDKAVLAGFIVAQDIHRRASLAMQQTQLLFKSPEKQTPIPNPYLRIITAQMLVMVRAAAELGFTPCSRARIELHTEAPKFDAWEDVG